MKKLLVAAAVLFFLSSNLYAQNPGLYIGIGGSYALQNFDTSDLDNQLRPYGLNASFKNSAGVNAKVGYHFSKLFSAEFIYDYFKDFFWSQTTRISGIPQTVDAKVNLMTFMIAGKLSPDIGSEVIRPYITVGAGLMQGNIDATGSGYESFTESNFDGGTCAKIGAGIDFYTTKNISIGIEGSYVMGFGNMKEMKYTNFNLGAAYHF
jgi:opacity protein-like surface antigen